MGARKKRQKRGLLRKLLLAPLVVLAGYYGIATVALIFCLFVTPPTTGVQIQRRVEAIIHGRDYEKEYDPVPGAQISSHLRHAVVAAEDGRFYEHWGIDFEAIRDAMEDNQRRGRSWRGGSTITQQLVKNLFMTTHSSWIRKALEVPLTYLAELILSKERILTLYLNVIEWGDGVYGAEAAARHYSGQSAAHLTRRQAAGLAAVIPAPRDRSPSRMGRYTSIILTRMTQMGW
ncbi:MAG TPA: monofunctional biosynthetic peptidoglycan transglycosylase [Rhodothermales bacterium]